MRGLDFEKVGPFGILSFGILWVVGILVPWLSSCLYIGEDGCKWTKGFVLYCLTHIYPADYLLLASLWIVFIVLDIFCQSKW